MMLSRRPLLIAIAGLMAFVASPAAAASLPRSLDPDSDGTMDLAEAKKAAIDLFDKLDHNHGGTLDRRELRGHLEKSAFTAADKDGDGTMTKDECISLVEQRFNAADRDGDGTLGAEELRSKSGRELLKLLK